MCPNCGKLISTDELRCPYCDIRRPGSWRANNFLTTGLLNTDQLIRIIIYTNIAMYVISLLFNPLLTSFSLNPLSFLSPDNKSLLLLGATGTYPVDQLDRWWTLLSANYLHGGILHILFNMYAFKQLAPLVAREFGISRMFIIYTTSGVIGFWISCLFNVLFTIGASASICGLIGAMLFYGKSRGGSIRAGHLPAGCRMGNRTFSFRIHYSGYKQLGAWRWNSCRHSVWIHSGLPGKKTRTLCS